MSLHMFSLLFVVFFLLFTACLTLNSALWKVSQIIQMFPTFRSLEVHSGSWTKLIHGKFSICQTTTHWGKQCWGIKPPACIRVQQGGSRRMQCVGVQWKSSSKVSWAGQVAGCCPEVCLLDTRHSWRSARSSFWLS